MAGRTRSAADERVLEAIFNPENPMGVIEVKWRGEKDWLDDQQLFHCTVANCSTVSKK